MKPYDAKDEAFADAMRYHDIFTGQAPGKARLPLALAPPRPNPREPE